MKWWCATIALLLITASCIASASFNRAFDCKESSGKLCPVDEAQKNRGFLEFRNRLEAAVASRDTSYLLQCVSENISLAPSKSSLRRACTKRAMQTMQIDSIQANKAFEYLNYLDYSRAGKKLFIHQWFENKEAKSEDGEVTASIWDCLGSVLSLGGVFTDDQLIVFRAPYVWTQWPAESDCDYAIIADNVVMEPMRFHGQQSAPSRETFSYDLVCRVFPWPSIGGKPETSVLVRTIDGREGYVPRECLRSPYSYGAEFTFSDGKWLITRFTEYP